ncbi:hypothetical protein NTE_02038 [Candidatus Nitrososphaera evergladensis SR1]|uniref:Uncharacterized protein n=1 Tax=Candidatus Nitrososphaera evergladensis SR1 TaxID=1459636 RepID=A0A075MSJ2_9ARCH|nr:hypothetical protein [Candidatus Nitrososphaera evergladensis]AIF84095.1 hypothetical protein NTE_02038 [Candidatus Nitrososphaera evergladensis SR1]
MQTAAVEEQQQERTVFCETHSKKCRFVSQGAKCACCGKRVCLCNYVL